MYIQLFTANKSKPPEIVGILVTNKNKILRFLADFTLDKGKFVRQFVLSTINQIRLSKRISRVYAEDNQFEADKAQVVTDVSAM